MIPPNCIGLAVTFNGVQFLIKTHKHMPFIKGLPPYKLSRVVTNEQKAYSHYQSLIERRDNAKRDIEYWTDFLNKGTLTIEQQRSCLYQIESSEIKYEKAVSEIKANK